ncbi:hypothetical protein NTE19_003393 [Vibrio fluvialis]|nr:hypothetical protein [Vibrio fluvialis]
MENVKLRFNNGERTVGNDDRGASLFVARFIHPRDIKEIVTPVTEGIGYGEEVIFRHVVDSVEGLLVCVDYKGVLYALRPRDVEYVIFPESEEAAVYRTGLEGWVSGLGRFCGNNERQARFEGSTHKRCDCGVIIRNQSICDLCSTKREIEEYRTYPLVVWDTATCVYDQHTDRYFNDPSDLLDHYADDEELRIEDARLQACEPTYARPIESEYWEEDLPEDMGFDECAGVDSETVELLEKLNAKLKTTILSYSPVAKRIDVQAFVGQEVEQEAI